MRYVLFITLVLGFAVAVPTPVLAAAPAYYPPVEWVPAARSNYDVGRTSPIVAIVIHETDGTWISAVNWFRNPRSRVSAHYLVRAYGGGIYQFVAESDTAYHARIANPWSIGIEHEYYPRGGIWHTDQQYRASAQLACAIARRYGIPVDRNHIIGHNEVWGADHSDPGPTWNWSYYMSLVRGCMQRAQGVARASVRTLPGQANVPAAGLEFDNVSDEVQLLQWDLAYLGYLDPDEVAAGGGRFGPLTQAAVTAFQEAKGLEKTGAYGEQTASALAQALATDLVDLPPVDLAAGTENEHVTKLQTALGKLGYMDLATGFYGDITTEAMARFQNENGIDADGAFSAVTRMALASRLRGGPPQSEPAPETPAPDGAMAGDLPAPEDTPAEMPFDLPALTP